VEQPSAFHQRCVGDSECEAEHPAQANTTHTSALGATPQVTPDNDEDGESRLKELREAATRSQSRTSVNIAPIWFSNYCKLGPFFYASCYL
jgi:hypothetical protein